VIDDGMILALGCCLYIGTGMVLGSLFHYVISRFAEHKPMATQVCSGARARGRCLVRELLPDSVLAAAGSVRWQLDHDNTISHGGLLWQLTLCSAGQWP
jgi:hypothetical protein